jgi:hypothetical protein
VLDTPELASLKPGFIDRLIHAGYAEKGAGFVTFDQGTGRLPGVRLLKA